jgi:hypothetical protein
VIEIVVGVFIGGIFTAGIYELLLRPKVKINEEYHRRLKEAYIRLNELAEQVAEWPDDKENKKGGDEK